VLFCDAAALLLLPLVLALEELEGVELVDD
jgi:hypothetical protein